MVGVPGKSKGCSTCRRRKKGCDQKRPICGQCAQSGYVCGGYQRDLTFVLHPASKVVEGAVFLPTKPQPPSLGLLPSLERSSIASQCRSLFFNVYMPRGMCEVRDQHILSCGHPIDWTELIPKFSSDNSSLDHAFSALTISRVGRSNGDLRLVKEGTRFYGRALRTLQNALYDPTRRHSEETLTSCIILGLFEFFEGAGGSSRGWVPHAEGAARILQIRGPDKHTDRQPHYIFLATRLPIIFSAILRRKKTFLAEDQWLTVPWRSQIKTGIDRLKDVITKVPGVLEEFDIARSVAPSETQRELLLSCLINCRSLQKGLSIWETYRKPNAAPTIKPYKQKGDNDMYPFTEEISFENHLFLNAHLVQWSANVIIADTAADIGLLLASLGYETVDMLQSTTFLQQEARTYSTRITQAIPYCLLPDMGDLGINNLSFPLSIAFKYFLKANETQICTWLIQTYNEMKSKKTSFDAASDFSFFPGSGDLLGILATADGTSSDLYSSWSSQETSSRIATMLGQQSTQPSSTTDSVRAERDFNVDYDHESGTEPNSPPNGAYSLSHETQSASSSRQGSVSGLSGLTRSQLAQIQLVNSHNGEFTFVAENPSRHYIDRSEV